MRELRYDVVTHRGGFAILITPDAADAFAAKHESFDAAAELAHKLRFVGASVHVRGERAEEAHLAARAKAPSADG
jgi:hypothetical protein